MSLTTRGTDNSRSKLVDAGSTAPAVSPELRIDTRAGAAGDFSIVQTSRAGVLASGSAADPIPDVAGFLDKANAESMSPVDINHGITNMYERIAQSMQAIVDGPAGSSASTAAGRTSVAPMLAGRSAPPANRPNWFAFAPHASETVGRQMALAALGLAACDEALEGKNDTAQAQARALHDGANMLTHAISAALEPAGLPREITTVLAAMAVTDADAFLDPRTTAITAERILAIIAGEHGTPIERARTIFATTVQMLTDGNQDIMRDVGGAGAAFLHFRDANPSAGPDEVLAEFRIGGSSPERAKQIYDYCFAHAGDDPRPSDFSAFAPTSQEGPELMIAGFALYVRAGRTSDQEEKDQLTAVANNLLAFREQRDAVAPAFADSRPQEVNRPNLIRAMTPAIRVSFGKSLDWTLDAYAHHLHRLGFNLLAPRVTKLDWSKFEDRFPAIIAAFEIVYQKPAAVWDMPLRSMPPLTA